PERLSRSRSPPSGPSPSAEADLGKSRRAQSTEPPQDSAPRPALSAATAPLPARLGAEPARAVTRPGVATSPPASAPTAPPDSQTGGGGAGPRLRRLAE